MIKIRVPATSANLGSGFDSLGIAFDLFNEFGFEKSSSFSLFGFPRFYNVKNNIIIKAYIATFSYAKKEVIPVKVIQLSQMVPPSRGLGSSAACIVSGILAANYYLGNILSKQECLNIATMIEGHPDNVSPCFFGALTSSFIDEEKGVNYLTFQVSPKLNFYALIPDFRVETKNARKVLPKMITYKDAIFNISRIIALPYYFKNGNLEMIKKVTEDALHEKYRYPLIADGIEIKKYLEEQGLVVLISGSGPTLLVISDKKIKIDLNKMLLKAKWEILPLRVNSSGAILEE